jgi:hypothetical protein
MGDKYTFNEISFSIATGSPPRKLSQMVMCLTCTSEIHTLSRGQGISVAFVA